MKERTEARRGEGVFGKVLAAMERLKREGVIIGVSLTATRENADEILSDEVVETFFDGVGATYAFVFHYMPIGRSFTLDLMIDAAAAAPALRAGVVACGYRETDEPCPELRQLARPPASSATTTRRSFLKLVRRRRADADRRGRARQAARRPRVPTRGSQQVQGAELEELTGPVWREALQAGERHTARADAAAIAPSSRRRP